MVREFRVGVVAAVTAGIGMDDGGGQMWYVVKDRVSGSFGDVMSLRYAQALVDHDLRLGVEAMADPSDAYGPHRFHSLDPGKGPFRLVDEPRVDRVQDAQDDIAPRAPQDGYDEDGDDDAGDGIGGREADRHPHGPGQHAERRESVGPRMHAVRHQGG